MSFTHLHVHTEYSLLDGACRIGKIAAAAKQKGFDSLAITEKDGEIISKSAQLKSGDKFTLIMQDGKIRPPIWIPCKTVREGSAVPSNNIFFRSGPLYWIDPPPRL